jgi:hypothetical protein
VTGVPYHAGPGGCLDTACRTCDAGRPHAPDPGSPFIWRWVVGWGWVVLVGWMTARRPGVLEPSPSDRRGPSACPVFRWPLPAARPFTNGGDRCGQYGEGRWQSRRPAGRRTAHCSSTGSSRPRWRNVPTLKCGARVLSRSHARAPLISTSPSTSTDDPRLRHPECVALPRMDQWISH